MRNVELHVNLLDLILFLRCRLFKEQRLSSIELRYCLADVPAIRQRHAILRSRRLTHKRRMMRFDRICCQHADAARQSCIQRLRRRLNLHRLSQLDFHELRIADYANAQRRSQTELQVRVEALGISCRQLGTADCTANGAHVFQMGDETNILILRNLHTQLHYACTSPFSYASL